MREKGERRKAARLWWAHGRTAEGAGQAAVGGGRPTAGRGPIRAEVRADPQERRGDYGRAYQREMYIYRSMTYFM